MKKYCIIAIIVLLVLIYFCFHPLVYQTNYFSKLGIGQSHLYDSIVQNKGEPLSIEQNDDQKWILYYDGLTIRYGSQLETGAFECVSVTGNQYTFGIWKIGVGTSRKKIESVYRRIYVKLKTYPMMNLELLREIPGCGIDLMRMIMCLKLT